MSLAVSLCMYCSKGGVGDFGEAIGVELGKEESVRKWGAKKLCPREEQGKGRMC